MEVLFEASFARDLKHIKDKQLLLRVKEMIAEVKAADELTDLRNTRKLQGYDTFYRIRLGDYRIGIEVENNRVLFVRTLHRKDIYRNFP